MRRVLLACLFMLTPFVPLRAEITRTLSLGSQGEDVRELQILLNQDSSTRVALSGPGSPGKESTYFGVLTEQAVKKFQQKYAVEVLFPADTWIPTGIVGYYTRAKLNTLRLPSATPPSPLIGSDLSSIPVPPSPPSTSRLSGLDILRSVFTAKPKVLSLSQYKASPGSKVSVYGSSFYASENTIRFSGSPITVANVPSPDGHTLSFIVPQDLPAGSYNLWIENRNGSSFEESFGAYFSVGNGSFNAPVLVSAEPNKVSLKEDPIIIIRGEHFEKTNTLFSSLGALENVSSSDGKTLRIRLSDFPASSQLKEAFSRAKQEVSFTGMFRVQTSVGFSDTSITVSIQP